MTTIGSATSSASQAVQAAQANTAAATTKTQTPPSGLPPVNLARAASANTVNAELVSSQWGIDPTSVAGVFGGAAESGGLFSGGTLLPLLANLSHANAEQALTLIGVETPKPGNGTATHSTASSTTAAAKPSQSALAQAASSSSAPMVVDPLWGRSA